MTDSSRKPHYRRAPRKVDAPRAAGAQPPAPRRTGPEPRRSPSHENASLRRAPGAAGHRPVPAGARAGGTRPPAGVRPTAGARPATGSRPPANARPSSNSRPRRAPHAVPATNTPLGAVGSRPRRPGRLGRRGTMPAAPLIAAGLAAVALIAFVIVPAAGALLQPRGGKNLTRTSAANQTVQPLTQAQDIAAGALGDLVAQTGAIAKNPPRTLSIGATKTGEGRATFCAVGDNLYNANLLEIADRKKGEVGDGEYAFDDFYSKISGTISSFDIAFINQETTLGGPDRFGYNGYPSYNTPDALAQTVADVGWDVVNTNSNHTYDTWVESIEHAQGVWGGLDDRLLTIGSYQSEEDRRAVRVVECNGLRIAFLSYSYGQNGYELSDLPNSYYAVPFDEEVMREDVARCRTMADGVVVYLHAGDEYQHEPSETQRAWAQACVDAGADLVIGSHVHVIQPMEWLTAPDGAKVLAVYGLGDFLAGYTNYPATIMSGMFSCTFERVSAPAKGEGKEEGKDLGFEREIRVTDVVWTPLIEHMQDGESTVRTVKGYTDKQARANELLKSLEDPLAWIKDTTNEVIGKDFTIDM